MSNESSVDITELLLEWNDGETQGQLIPWVYDELHRIAARCLRKEWRHEIPGQTSLVHAAYIRLLGERVEWRDRDHFFGTVARIMRRLVIDYARRYLRVKRHGLKVPLDEIPPIDVDRAEELVDVGRALKRLEAVRPEQAEIVDLRFFVGLSHREAAAMLGVSVSTVKRRWSEAKKRLHRLLAVEKGEV